MTREFTRPEFYSTWPSFGKNLSFQWDEIRRNQNALNSVAKGLHLETDTTKPLADGRLSGLAFGQFDNSQEFRFFFDKDDDRFKLQRNTGTEDVPVWNTILAFNDTGGALQKVREFGGSDTPDTFYFPHTLGVQRPDLTVEDTGDGQPKIQYNSQFRIDESGNGAAVDVTNSTRLRVQRGTGLSVVEEGTGIARIEFNDIGSVNTFYFQTPAKEWQVSHNLSTSNLNWNLFDVHQRSIFAHDPDKGLRFNLLEADFSDENTAYFYFNNAQAGTVILSGGGISQVVTNITVKDGVNEITSSEVNFNGADFYISKDLNGDPVINNITPPSDHGSLTGLADDDHTQYILASGVRDFAGDQSMGGNKLTNLGKPTSATDAARLQDVGPPFYLNDAQDVFVPSPSEGHVLTYDSVDGRWEGKAPQGGAFYVNDLLDVFAPAPTNDQVLTFNSSNNRWEAQKGGAGGGAFYVNDLLDVLAPGPDNNDSLRYNSSTGLWESVSGVITVKESNEVFNQTSDSIAFDSIHFYITNDDGGKPLVSFNKDSVASTKILGSIDFVQDVTLSQAEANIAFYQIPATADHLIIRAFLRSDVVATADGALAQLNSNTGSVYHTGLNQLELNDVSTIAGAGAADGRNVDRWHFGRSTGASADANLFSIIEVFIPRYTQAFRKNFQSRSSFADSSADTEVANTFTTGSTSITDIINRINIFPNSGSNWLSGSQATLLGIKDIADEQGEVNTASNLGSGEGIFAQKVDDDLQFKSLVAGSNIAFESSSTDITIHADRFYLNVGQTDDTPTFKDINTIKFNRDQFYVVQNSPNTDEVIVNLRTDPLTKVVGKFTNSIEWQLTHDFNDEDVVWSTYIGNEGAIPGKAVVTDTQAFFYWSAAVTGKAVLIA